MIDRSTGWEAAAASWPGGPSCDSGCGAGARALAPWVPSPLAPRYPGQWGRGCHSIELGAHGSGTCRAGTCALGGPLSPPAASRGARCALAGGSPAGTGPVGRRHQAGGRSHAPAAGHLAGGQGQRHGSVLHKPASLGRPACARGARSVPRPAGEEGEKETGWVSVRAVTLKSGRDLWVPGCWIPWLQCFLPAWQSAGAAGLGLRDGAQALAASRTVLWDLIHAGDQTFLAQLVSGIGGGMWEGEIKQFVKCRKATELLQVRGSQGFRSHVDEQMGFLEVP